LRLVFDPALDGPAWPGLLGDGSAVFGESWCGPLGLLGRLETELGLGGRAVSATERALALTTRLGGCEGWWSRSFEADPVGTAKRLLGDRDTLALWGWRGEPVSERLAALWRATEGALAGVPDRLRRVLELVPRRAVELESVVVFDQPAVPPWRSLLPAAAAALPARPHEAVRPRRRA